MKVLFIVGLTLLGSSFIWLVATFVLGWDEELDEPRTGLTPSQFAGRKIQL